MALYAIDCWEALADLEAYVDGELPDERKSVLERHLAECPPCVERGEFRRRLQLIVRAKCGTSAPLPPEVSERVRKILSSEH